MSEDRTQPPSQRRRQLAREQGQAAHSPELTAAAGWLAAVVALGCCGEELAGALAGLMRFGLSTGDVASMAVDAAGLSSRIRGMAWALAWPLGWIVAAFAAGATAAHQCQVRGLWSAKQLLPDPGRLWAPGHGPGVSARTGRAGGSAIKAAIFLAVLAWLIRAGWADVLGLGSLNAPAMAAAAGRLLFRLAAVLAGVLAVLGLLDYGLCYWRFESMLRTTPDEQRRPSRVRRRCQRAVTTPTAGADWRGDAAEPIAGATLALHGAHGLTLILSGGPPPRQLQIRAVARTGGGLRLRRSAEAANLPQLDDDDLARRLARHAAGNRPIPAELIARLADAWPERASAAEDCGSAHSMTR